MVGIIGGRRPSIRSKSGTPVTITAAGTALGSGPSVGTTSTANNVAIVSSGTGIINRPGPSINQISGVGSTSVIRTIASSGGAASSSTNYKLSIASMLLAMKNQTLGAYSPSGSKAGGSITENYSGVNLG